MIGAIKYGSDNAKRKILVLGNSKTTGMLYPFINWCECLYKLAVQKEFDWQIINCGHNGADSSVKLLKLLKEGFGYKHQ